MAVAQGVFVTLDCADPRPLGEFWAAMLGGDVVYASATTVAARAGNTSIVAFKIGDYAPPTWPDHAVPKQIHLDLAVTDLDAAAAEAERLGARPAQFQPSLEHRRILLDPAGHPFCLTTQVPPALLA